MCPKVLLRELRKRHVLATLRRAKLLHVTDAGNRRQELGVILTPTLIRSLMPTNGRQSGLDRGTVRNLFQEPLLNLTQRLVSLTACCSHGDPILR